MTRSDLVDVEVALLHETEAAVLVTDSGPDAAAWLPRSQIEIVKNDSNRLYTVTMPEWLAMKNNFI